MTDPADSADVPTRRRGGFLSRRAWWGLAVSIVVLVIALIADVRRDDAFAGGLDDAALADSIAALFPEPADSVRSPSTGPVAAHAAARRETERRVREDLRAFAFDLARTGKVRPQRAKQLSYLAVTEAYRLGVPVPLVLGVMLIENPEFKTTARSSVGACGLMQVMPFWVRTHGPRYGYGLCSDDRTNVRTGLHILSDYVETHGLEKGLLRYNGCVRGTRTRDCFLYPHKVRRAVERQAVALCPSRSFDLCVVRPHTRIRAARRDLGR